MLSLGARQGETVEVTAEGDNADDVLARLVEELSTDRDADPDAAAS